jgi:hypothetical protein
MKDNKLIAEFMGWDILSPTTIPPNLHLSNLEADNGEIPNFKFHSSWDWLMPVIKKIEAKNYWFNRLDGDVSIVNDKGVIINTPMSDGGIDMYYQTVVEFIKRTNLKPKQL